MEKIAYGGWANCVRLANDTIEMIATLDVGPRIMRFGFIGQDNELKEIDQDLGQTGSHVHRFYGGHRLWHAPEEPVRTYWPDNAPVDISPLPDGVRLTQPVEAATGLQKEIDLHLAPAAARVTVIHRLKNTNLWSVEFAPWALTMFAPGGIAILPLPPRGSHVGNLQPTAVLALWAYTDLSDPRWTWGQKYIWLKQDPARSTPQKIGASLPDGWLAYARSNHLFIKQFAYDAAAVYPDRGCNAEVFTNGEMLELETLGPLVRVEPGRAVTHSEVWQLFDDVPLPATEAAVERHVLPRLWR